MAGNQTRAEATITLNGQQAEQVLEQLSNKAKQLKADITTAAGAGDSKKVVELNKELKQVESTIKNVRKETYDYQSVLNNISTAPLKNLEKAKKTLQKELKNLTRDTEKYKETAEKLKSVNEAIREINDELKDQPTLWDRAVESFNKYAAIAAAVVATIIAIGASIKQLIDANAKMADSFADVQKTTGLSQTEIKKLNSELKAINTRTPRSEMLKLAADAGKLGITGRKNILEFVRAANQINVALGEDLGEDAIKQIGKLNDLFGETDKLGIEKSLLATGSAINSLGQSSTASEAYLVEFAKRMGGVGSAANMTVPQILGFGATLDQLGQTSESSATALSKFMIKMVTDTEQIAKAAGIEVGKLNEMLKRDTNEALITVFEELNKKGGLANLAPIFKDLGAEGSKAASLITALSGNIQTLREQQEIANTEFKKADSITKEYAVKNENLAASWEKLQKRITGMFTSSWLMDFFAGLVQGLEKTTRKMDPFIIQLEKVQEKVVKLQTDIIPLTRRYEELRAKTVLTADEQTELNNIMKTISETIPGVAAEFDRYGNVISLNTEKIYQYIEAEKLRLNYINKGAIKEVESEIKRYENEIKGLQEKLTSWDKYWNDKIKYAEKQAREDLPWYKENFKSQDSNEKYLQKLKQENEERKATIQQQIAETGALLKGADEQLRKLKGTTIEEQTNLLIQRRKFNDMNKEQLDTWIRDEQNAANKYLELAKEIYKTRFTQKPISDENHVTAEQTKPDKENTKDKEFQEELNRIENENKEIRVILKKRYAEGLDDANEYSNKIHQSEIYMLNKKIELYQKYGKSTAEIEEKIYDALIKDIEQTAKEIEDFNRQFQKELDKTIKSEFGSQTLKDKFEKSTEDAQNFFDELARIQTEAEQFKKRWILLTPEDERAAELAELDRFYKASTLKHDEYNRAKSNINKKYFDQQLAQLQNYIAISNQGVNLATSYYEMQKNRELRAAGDSEERKEEINREYFEKSKKARIAEARIAGALAIMQIWAGNITGNPLVDAIIKAGLTAVQIVTTELQVASMKAQQYSGSAGGASSESSSRRVVAQGREEGGQITVEREQDGKIFNAEYNPQKRGYVRKPTVIVGESGDEFVVNAEAAKNPTVKPVLDIIDMAQKQGYAASLNLQKITGKENGGNLSEHTEPATEQKQYADKNSEQLADAIMQLTTLIKELKTNNIKAYVVLSELNRKQEILLQSERRGNRI
jgi:TP901 family phage tail tape measure protein